MNVIYLEIENKQGKQVVKTGELIQNLQIDKSLGSFFKKNEQTMKTSYIL